MQDSHILCKSYLRLSLLLRRQSDCPLFTHVSNSNPAVPNEKREDGQRNRDCKENPSVLRIAHFGGAIVSYNLIDELRGVEIGDDGAGQVDHCYDRENAHARRVSPILLSDTLHDRIPIS
jgi:hypothetical protein